jgi:hypothetical protein
MNVTDTKLLQKCCSKCDKIKTCDLFIKNRNICKDCHNKKCREKYSIDISETLDKICNRCNETKPIENFIKKRNICKDCNNFKRQQKYNSDETHRQKLISTSINFKKRKIIKKKQLFEEEIGIGNMICKYCLNVKSNCRFRKNRRKCKDCERNEPISKIIRNVRSRISYAIQKDKHTIEYLDCSCREYFNWITSYDDKYNYDNHGTLWHIDHVIPVSRFNLSDEYEQMIAFNWRNTMPLLVHDNLSKNNKIIKSQVEQHFNHLIEYHEKNNINLPIKFIDLFAKHLDAGSPLEPI